MQESEREFFRGMSDSDSFNYAAFVRKIQTGNINAVRAMLRQGPNLNVRYLGSGGMDYSFLHLAAEFGRYAIAKLLIDKGMNVDDNHDAFQNQSYSETPLATALTYRKEKTAILLIERDANLTFRNVAGAGYLHYSVSPKVVELLLEKGSDPNLKDNSGVTPLRNADTRSIPLLLQHHADPNIRANDGLSPAEIAIANAADWIAREHMAKEEAFDNPLIQLLVSRDDIVVDWKNVTEYAQKDNREYADMNPDTIDLVPEEIAKAVRYIKGAVARKRRVRARDESDAQTTLPAVSRGRYSFHGESDVPTQSPSTSNLAARSNR